MPHPAGQSSHFANPALVPAPIAVLALVVVAIAACSPDDDQRRTADEDGRQPGAEQADNAVVRADLLLEDAERATNAGDSPLARQLYRQAAGIFEAAGERSALGRALLGLGILEQVDGQGEAARDLFARAAQAFADEGDRLGEGRVALSLGALELSRFNDPQALASFRRAVSLFHELGEWRLEAQALQGVGDSEWRLLNAFGALSALTHARAIFDAVEDGDGARLAEQARTEIAAETDGYDDARKQLHEQITRAAWNRDYIAEANSRLDLGHLESRAARVGEAREAFAGARQFFVNEEIAPGVAATWAATAALEERIGNLYGASLAYESALEVCRQAGLSPCAALALIGLGRVESARGADPTPAFSAARELMTEGEDPHVDGMLLLALGRLQRGTGLAGEAEANLRRAEAVLEEAGFQSAAGEAVLVQAGLHGDAAQTAEAAAAYSRALAGFIGARDKIGEATARAGLAGALAKLGNAQMEARVQYRIAADIFAAIGLQAEAREALSAATTPDMSALQFQDLAAIGARL